MTTHAVPTINVNLKPCDCGFAHDVEAARRAHAQVGVLGNFMVRHAADCSGAPILLPCPIPRPVTFEVRLSDECSCDYAVTEVVGHMRGCPCLPLKVSCSVSKKTWEESEVMGPPDADPSIMIHWTMAQRNALLDACRARWALVKALVLSKDTLRIARGGPRIIALIEQRDAVYAALADMARAEEAARAAQRAVDFLLPGAPLSPSHWSASLPSGVRLEAFVEHLIEQVGVL